MTLTRAIDTSVAVPAFASWHELHRSALDVVADAPLLPAHVALETYAVLTRLPPPHRVSGGAVHAFLDANFAPPWLVLDGEGHAALVAEFDGLGIAGGSVYDALIAVTARAFGATLLSADHRARPVYDAIGTTVEMIG